MSLDKLLNRQRIKNPNKITMKPILNGKLTYIGLAISAAGFFGRRFGLVLPEAEINSIATFVAANWDTFAELGGLLTAAYGKWRKRNDAPKAEVVK